MDWYPLVMGLTILIGGSLCVFVPLLLFFKLVFKLANLIWPD